MAKPKPKRTETIVKATVVYECGRCGNMQRRVYTSEDGLLELGDLYCGKCVRGRNLSTLSRRITYSSLRVVEVDQDDKVHETTTVKFVEKKPAQTHSSQ